MKTQNDSMLKALHVVSWIIFTGLCIEAGALLFNFIFTLYKPIAANNIYKGLNLSMIYENHLFHYIGLMSFVIALALLKAYLFFLVVKLFMKLNVIKPFTIEIARLIEKISFEVFAIAFVSISANLYTKRLIQSGYEAGNVMKFWNDTTAFLMLAAIIYIISKIFNKGIELQNENDLTV